VFARFVPAATVLAVMLTAAAAQDVTSKGITVSQPWARATPGGATVGGAFLEIKAAPGVADRLVAVKSPVAGAAELHNHIMEGGVAKMRRVDDIKVPAGGSVSLKPGGYHVMLIDLKQPLKEGDSVPLTLVFDKAGKLDVDVMVEEAEAQAPASGG
jgi:copper(I)-binding protein